MKAQKTKLEMFELALIRIFESWRGKKISTEYNEDGDLVIRPYGCDYGNFSGPVFDRIAVLANAMEMNYWIGFDNRSIYARFYE